MFIARFKTLTFKVRRVSVKRSLGTILIVSGLLFVFVKPIEARISSLRDFQIYIASIQNNDLEPIQIDTSLVAQNIESESIPTRVLIPRSDIDLSVSPAKVVRGRWEVFADKAGFGLGSATPQEEGNTVIFAHAKEGQFLNLKDVKQNDEILVFTDKNWFSYKVSEIKQVRPTDTSVISQTDEAVLTLFTCSGFADSKRLIVVARKVR